MSKSISTPIDNQLGYLIVDTFNATLADIDGRTTPIGGVSWDTATTGGTYTSVASSSAPGYVSSTLTNPNGQPAEIILPEQPTYIEMGVSYPGVSGASVGITIGDRASAVGSLVDLSRNALLWELRQATTLTTLEDRIKTYIAGTVTNQFAYGSGAAYTNAIASSSYACIIKIYIDWNAGTFKTRINGVTTTYTMSGYSNWSVMDKTSGRVGILCTYSTSAAPKIQYLAIK